ncbi:hypothetical protein MMC28_010660 [Mycoblastus sanguinarius]|nr:hypothetical protein [Mycoblastus sanguinarius]
MSNENLPTPSPLKLDRPILTPRKALVDTLGNACVQEFYLTTPPVPKGKSSPTRSLASRAHSTSPWRIRLTVSAEQVDGIRGGCIAKSSPTKRVTECTTTTTVPLKDGDDTPPAVAKRGRGRPRKSMDSPVKRHGTPKPNQDGRRRTIPKASDVAQDLDPSKATNPPKKNRGRPRKSIESTPESLCAVGKDVVQQTSGKTLAAGSVARSRSKGRRKEITPMNISHDPENESLLEAVKNDPALGDTADTVDQRGSDPTDEHQEFDSILESEGFSMVSVSSLPSAGGTSISPAEQDGKLGLSGASLGLADAQFTPSKTSSLSLPPPLQDIQPHLSSRTLAKSMGGTPKLARVVRAGIALQGVLSPKNRGPEPGSPLQPKPTVRDQPPVLQTSNSPKERLDNLFSGFGAGTRRELKAGLRLGEELAKRQRAAPQRRSAKMDVEDDVFSRNVRLGAIVDYPRLPGYNGQNPGYSLKVPDPGRQVTYPSLSNNQLPSPERSEVDPDEDRIDWKANATEVSRFAECRSVGQTSGNDTPIKVEDSTQDPSTAQIPAADATAIDFTMLAKEADWQREREAVSRQIEMANKSQVIVIESDEEGDEEQDNGDDDIWQAQARSMDTTEVLTTNDPEGSDILPEPEVFKPRRSKLPSLWRRDSQIIYSDEVEPTEADLFWQPDQAQANASRKRNDRKKQTQKQTQEPEAPLAETSHDTINQFHQEEATPNAISKISSPELPVRTTKVSSPENSVGQHDLAAKVEHCRIDEYGELSEREDTILTFTSDRSVETITTSQEKGQALIDPLLFQKHIRPLSASTQLANPIPTSWLGRLTAPIWSVFTPVAPLPPPATKEDILCSSPHEPLCQLTPWEDCHFRALGPLYYASLFYGSHLFPFNKSSPSARFCGSTAVTTLGWSRSITSADCGVTDAFMVLLDQRGYALGPPGERWIDEGMVVGMCVTLWAGMVMRGEVDADKSKGERTGLRKQRDRMWTREDVCWEGNQSEYFERKRREFGGLPSWKVES